MNAYMNQFITSSIHPFIHGPIHQFVHSAIIHLSTHPCIHSSRHQFFNSRILQILQCVNSSNLHFFPIRNFIQSPFHSFIHCSMMVWCEVQWHLRVVNDAQHGMVHHMCLVQVSFASSLRCKPCTFA